jgi:hypothetical protein
MADESNATAAAAQAATDELKALLARAERGDLTVLSRLREVLDNHPEIWEHYGNMSAQAEGALVKLAAGTNILFSESLIRKQAALRKELAGPDADRLERALAERAALCHLHVCYWDAMVAQGKGNDAARLNAVRKHQDSAHKRHLDAVKMLATVRKLLRPARSPLDMLTPVEEQSEPAVVKRARGRSSKPALHVVN